LKVTIKHRLEYAGARLVMLCLGFLPETLAYGGISALGQLFFVCSKRRQGYALAFLRRAYPEGKTDRELLALARRATGNFLRVTIDMIRVHRVIANGTFESYVEGIDEVKARLGTGPVLVVSGHLGSWEVGAIVLAKARAEAHVIARLFKNPLLHRFMEKSRRAAGLHLHSRRGGIRGLARALKNGAGVMQAVDQNQRLRGIFVPFFGKIASTERAAATLAVRQGYPVAICSCFRKGKGFKFQAVVHEVIQPEVPTDKTDVVPDVIQLVQRINGVLEQAILSHPEQYLWVHDRYRTQPEDGLPLVGESEGDVADRESGGQHGSAESIGQEFDGVRVDPEAI
jgi:KDO2-lipid IV(A) lauroyltransferase